MVVVDCYSRYLDIAYLSKLTVKEVVEKMKACFTQHGVPETVVTDNGTLFSSGEFKQFAGNWNFCHVTSSPHYPQANAQAESAMKIAKGILKQTDPFLTLLTNRSMPIPALGANPAELACGKKFRTTLPVLPKTLIPCPIGPATVRARDIQANRLSSNWTMTRAGRCPKRWCISIHRGLTSSRRYEGDCHATVDTSVQIPRSTSR